VSMRGGGSANNFGQAREGDPLGFSSGGPGRRHDSLKKSDSREPLFPRGAQIQRYLIDKQIRLSLLKKVLSPNEWRRNWQGQDRHIT